LGNILRRDGLACDLKSHSAWLYLFSLGNDYWQITPREIQEGNGDVDGDGVKDGH